jgi:spore coat polysaccharide biosynthesis protein SpsF
MYPTLPDGLDAEIFSFETLDYTYKHAVLPSEVEHVTPYIPSHPEIFKIGNWTYHENLSQLRWTVDEPEDFEFVRLVIEKLYPINRNFRMNDVLELIYQRPDLAKINTHITRNEGLLKSLAEDKKLFKKKTG